MANGPCSECGKESGRHKQFEGDVGVQVRETGKGRKSVVQKFKPRPLGQCPERPASAGRPATLTGGRFHGRPDMAAMAGKGNVLDW